MDRSLYNDGVTVRQVELNRTENDSVFHILERHVDNSTLGVVNGLEVIPNTGNAALINIAPGYGYAPNGEFTELKVATTAVSLSDATLDVVNYVCLVYTETFDDARPHETNGTSLPTAANRGSRVRVFTQTQFNALPSSSGNLALDARDRTMVIAAITAQGAGTALTTANIVLPPPHTNAISIVDLDNNITGIIIASASPNTPDGTGSLFWDVSAGTLQWVAPGDITGNNVNVLGGGTYALQSLPSNTTIIVSVNTSLLPGSDQTDNIVVQSLYYTNPIRHSAADFTHRSMIGGGIPTPNNPHGMTLSDLGPSGSLPVIEHQDTFHSNGIRRDSDTTALQCTVDTGTSPDRLNVAIPGNLFVALNGVVYTTSNQLHVTFSDVVDNTQILFDIYAKPSTAPAVDIERRERARFVALSTFTNSVQLVDISTLTTSGSASIAFDDAANTISYTAPGGSAGVAKAIPASSNSYMRLFSSDGVQFIDLLVNSAVNGTGNATANITVTALPTTLELEERIRLATVVFSGASSGFLGNGFGANNAPNTLADQRLFGVTGLSDLNDNTGIWARTPTSEVAGGYAYTTSRPIALLDTNYDGTFLSVGGKVARAHAKLSVFFTEPAFGTTPTQVRTGIYVGTQLKLVSSTNGSGITSDFITSYSSTTAASVSNYTGLLNLAHTGTISAATYLNTTIQVLAGAAVTALTGINIANPVGTLTIGVEISTLIGLNIGNITAGASNFAIKTGTGLIQFGDRINFSAFDTGIQYGVAGGIWARSASVVLTRDGSTNPGANGARIGTITSGQATALNAALDASLSNPIGADSLLIEATGNTGTPISTSLILATTNSSGAIIPRVIVKEDNIFFGHLGQIRINGLNSAALLVATRQLKPGLLQTYNSPANINQVRTANINNQVGAFGHINADSTFTAATVYNVASVSAHTTGNYTVNFNAAISDTSGCVPVVSASPASGAVCVRVFNATASSFQVTIVDRSTGSTVDCDFYFMALGNPANTLT